MKWYPTSSSCLLLAGVVIALKISQTVVRADLGDNVPDLGEEEVHRFQQQKIKVGPPASLMRDRGHIQDKDHIRHHLEGTVDFDAMAKDMTSEEMEFYFFHSHDDDRDKRLDGLELMQSVHHADQGWEGHQHPGNHGGQGGMTEETIIGIVDRILADDDINGDGYVDYVEFSRRMEGVTDAEQDNYSSEEEEDYEDDDI